MDHSQETVFVWKRGHNQPKNHLSTRLATCQPNDSPVAAHQRVSSFLQCMDLLNRTRINLINHHHEQTQNELAKFVDECGEEIPLDFHTRLPTVFMLRSDVETQVSTLRKRQPDWHIVSIHSKECPNFRSTVKLIVNRLTANDTSSSDRRLTYDFHVLKNTYSLDDCLFVVLEDTESFDINVVRELVSYMQTYTAELRLHLVLNLHFPLALTEQQLFQKHIVNMNVHVLEGMPSITQLISDIQHKLYEETNVKLNNELVSYLKSKSNLTEVSNLLKYALLAYFAGNTKAVGDHTQTEVTHEVLRHAFNPNYRPLLEQALMDASLHIPDADRLAVPTSVLYQLSRESSIYINIYDFYCAFKEMVRLVPNCGDWDKQSMAIFLESISELKMIGVLRDCKRKFECVEKASWKGV